MIKPCKKLIFVIALLAAFILLIQAFNIDSNNKENRDCNACQHKNRKECKKEKGTYIVLCHRKKHHHSHSCSCDATFSHKKDIKDDKRRQSSINNTQDAQKELFTFSDDDESQYKYDEY